MSFKTIILTSGSSWTVPPDWSSINTIFAIGAGGAGGSGYSFHTSVRGGGGGGGAFATLSNITSLTPGSTININIGQGGAGGVNNGTATWFNSSSFLYADYGRSGTGSSSGAATGAGGQASNCVPSIGAYSGGSGGHYTSNSNISFAGGGGGGAGGPSGAGGSVPSAQSVYSWYAGSGGGGANGGAAGGNSTPTMSQNGGAGGASLLTAGGSAGVSGANTAGGAGSLGSGGGGGAYGTTSSTGAAAGGAGGTGAPLYTDTTTGYTAGSGGGAGGAGSDGVSNAPNGANGGLYGGGGSGAAAVNGTVGTGGNGANGVLIIVYLPIEQIYTPITGVFPPASTPTMTNIIPSYLYKEWEDDSDLQAFVASYNSIAQTFLNTVNGLNLPIYTGSNISGPLLDWVAQGIYGMARPALQSNQNVRIGPLNTYQFNQLALNTTKLIGPSNVAATSDDTFKRILTWAIYKGDGRVFNVRWLKRRIMRFLIGSNGSAPNIDQTYQISVTFGTNKEVAIKFIDSTISVVKSAAMNTSVMNGAYLNEVITKVTPLTPLPYRLIFQEAVVTGAIELPFQFTWNVIL